MKNCGKLPSDSWSLQSRTTKEVDSDYSPAYKILAVLSPLVLFKIAAFCTLFVSVLLIQVFGSDAQSAAFMSGDGGSVISIIVYALEAFVGIAVLVPLARCEYPRLTDDAFRPKRIILTVVASVATALALNMLFSMTGFTASDAAYSQVESEQFGHSLIVGVCLYGVLMPIAEETAFRLLTYNRARRFWGFVPALLISAAIFGVSHFNLVQGVYGFLMGILIVLIYEKFGAFIYAVFAHASANCAVYIIMKSDTLKETVLNVYGLIVCSVIAIISLVLIITSRRDGHTRQ